MRSTRIALGLSLVGALLLAACGGDDEADAVEVPVTPTVNVGRTTEPLSQLLAEIYGQGMENAGVRVGRKDPVESLDVLHQQLAAGTVQFFPETTVGLLERLGVTDIPATTTDQLAAINEALPAEQSVSGSSSATVTQVVACSTSTIDEFELTDLSGLAEVADEVTLGGTAAFETSAAFGLELLNTSYDTSFAFTASGDTDGDVTAAVAAGDVDCGVMSGLEPTITTLGLLPLTDDLGAAPVDAVVPLWQAVAATPEAVAVVTQIDSLLTPETLRALLVKLEAGESADVLAKAFIASQASSG